MFELLGELNEDTIAYVFKGDTCCKCGSHIHEHPMQSMNVGLGVSRCSLTISDLKENLLKFKDKASLLNFIFDDCYNCKCGVEIFKHKNPSTCNEGLVTTCSSSDEINKGIDMY